MSLLKHPRVARHLAQGSKFVIVGSIGASVDLVTAFTFVNAFGFSEYEATAISTFFAVVVVFIGNKFFTFKNREKKTGRQAGKFLLVYGIAICANLGMTWVFIHVGAHYLIAKVMAIGIGVVWNYAMSHAFIFKKSEAPITPII